MRIGATAIAAAALVSCGGGGGGGNDGDGPMTIQTVNNRADLVSDGDALVVITAPPGQLNQSFKVTVNGRDVTSAFTRTSNRTMSGLLTGLAVGENVVIATTGSTPVGLGVGSSFSERLVITNHPRSGPIYSGGEHITPFYCATPTPQPVNGTTPATNASGLSGTPDANCNIPTEYKLYYRTTTAAASTANPAGCSLGMPDPVWNTSATAATIPAQPAAPANACWKPYTERTTPADMATTTTDTGATVPFIVRVERGTMNRGIYDIVVLFDPTRPWSATAPQGGWNGKVYYNFGFSTGQPRRQARHTLSWSSQEAALAKGFMYVGNSMTDSLRNSNRVMMTETVMMMKEHVGDTYGLIKYTMGTGCSGGSINSNMSLSIFPGLLDGVVTSCTYPDSETTTLEVGDCVLLVEAYQKPALMNLWTTAGLTQAQINEKKAAINGHPDQSACHGWYNAFGNNGRAGLYAERFVVDNASGALANTGRVLNNCELPNTAVYDPRTPESRAATAGLPRCNAWSWAANIWGTVPGTSQARDTRDNVGVQYGLRALLEGKISAEEFVTLNEAVGGIDRDSTSQAARTSADVEALDIAYRSGIVASGRNLAKSPIIDLRGWDDSNINTPPGVTPGTNAIPIHHQWYSFAIRDRIVRDYGDAGNQALWRFARNGLQPSPSLSLEAFNVMDQWLSALVTEPSNRSMEQKARATRPAAAADFCIPSSDPAQTTRITDMAACDADPFLKPSLSPRQVAGGPRAEDVLKCQLKPLNAADYGAVTFTGTQWTRLQAVFPSGVCDWSKPGVGQQAAVSPLSFRAGPGGQPLGDAPVSRRFD